jgi:hypothetical protein
VKSDVRDNSTGRRILRAKQEIVLEVAKDYAQYIQEHIDSGDWDVAGEASPESVFLESVRALRKAERGDHAVKKRR